MQQQEKYDEVNGFRIMSARRLDWHQARIIEEGIDLQSMHGTDFAASFLKSKKVDFDLALRVLAYPQARRHYNFQ